MEINFRTKEERNRLQREEFLKLEPVERFYAFFDLMEAPPGFSSFHKRDISHYFIIEIKDEPIKK